MSKIYAIGGQIRDEFLNRPIHDRDYVVVGSTIEKMLSLGFKQVGAEFPVFLHPKTKDEYALARTEKKIGNKHTDFAFEFNPTVTLFEDCSRRDFTINAICRDIETGEIIDYFNGVQDIENKIIRHINDNFKCDPLRILRAVRFSCQLNFTIAEKTKDLCKRMVLDGMLEHLTEERVWKEIEKALKTEHFYKFLEGLNEINALKVILPEVYELKNVEENPKWHPEGNTYNHTLLCLKEVKKHKLEDTNLSMVNFGVLCHDLGKQLTPIEKRPSHHGHDNDGKEIVERLCARLKIPNIYRDFAKICCKYHMKLYQFLDMHIKKQYDIIYDITKFKDRTFLDLLLKVHACDLFGKERPCTDEEFQYMLNTITRINLIYFIMCGVGLEQLPEETQLMLSKYSGKKFGELYRAAKISYLKHHLKM